jgi:hypothetical protein
VWDAFPVVKTWTVLVRAKPGKPESKGLVSIPRALEALDQVGLRLSGGVESLCLLYCIRHVAQHVPLGCGRVSTACVDCQTLRADGHAVCSDEYVLRTGDMTASAPLWLVRTSRCAAG